MHAPTVGVDKGAVEGTNMPCFLVPRTGFFADSGQSRLVFVDVQRGLDLVKDVNRSDVGSGATQRAPLVRENGTRKTMGEQPTKAYFDVLAALEGCIVQEDLEKYNQAKQVKRGFVRAVVANFVLCVLLGPQVAGKDPDTRATLLNLVMRHTKISNSKEYVWVTIVRKQQIQINSMVILWS